MTIFFFVKRIINETTLIRIFSLLLGTSLPLDWHFKRVDKYSHMVEAPTRTSHGHARTLTHTLTLMLRRYSMQLAASSDCEDTVTMVTAWLWSPGYVRFYVLAKLWSRSEAARDHAAASLQLRARQAAGPGLVFISSPCHNVT